MFYNNKNVIKTKQSCRRHNMGISKLFREKKKQYYFFQNKGTLVESYEQALAIFEKKIDYSLDPEPFLVFVFENKRQAEKAILKIPFIHKAESSKYENGLLICDKPEITYGAFGDPGESDKYAVLIMGRTLTDKLYTKVEKILMSNGGELRRFCLPKKLWIKYHTRKMRLSKHNILYD